MRSLSSALMASKSERTSSSARCAVCVAWKPSRLVPLVGVVMVIGMLPFLSFRDCGWVGGRWFGPSPVSLFGGPLGRIWLSQDQATVDGECLAGHGRCVVTGEHRHNGSGEIGGEGSV